jgi:RNA polymerase sigma-70 factor (ECF subfamily)
MDARAEDGPAFEDEFDRLFARAYAVARRLTGDTSAAEDLAAEAVARAYARWHTVRNYDFRHAWVARVVTNLAIDVSKKRRKFDQVFVSGDRSDETVLRLALLDALRRLPRREREMVALRFLADMSVDDVADSLGVTSGTVKATVHRALQKLRIDFSSEMSLVPEGA